MPTRSVVAVLLASTLGACAAHAQPLKCPESKLDEIRAFKPLPALLTLFTPLGLIHALGRDRMADLPRKPVSFRVVDDAGRAVPNALVAVIHKESNRFLAEGATGGPAIGLPKADYIINAAATEPGGAVRYGSTTFKHEAKDAAAVTVTLTARADAAVPKPLAASAPVASKIMAGFDSALVKSVVLAVMRQGSNVRSKDGNGDGAILAQYEMADGPARTFLLPGSVGKYDVVAMLCAPRVPLTRWTVSTTPVQIGIAAPERIAIGSALEVTLSGALSAASKVRFGKSGDDDGKTEELPDGGTPRVQFDVGYDTGTFQIAVLAHDDAVLARRNIIVERREIEITGPDTVQLGMPANFDWTGNGAAALEVWTLPNGTTPARRLGLAEKGRLLAPVGTFEVRVVRRSAAEGEGTLARKRVKVEGKVFEDAPTEATVGQTLEVKMAFDVEFFDQLEFYKRGKKSDGEMSYKRNRGPRLLAIDAPTKPGLYDLVYKLGTVHDKVEVARVPVEVRAR